MANCILWDNSPDEIFHADDLPLPTVIFSNVKGGHTGTGNIDEDPLFADPDLRLSAGSPCIDAGHNACLPDTDLDGNPRFADDPATADTGCGMGCGVPVVVDMGAYEYQGDPCSVKCGDIDGDGVVGINDFLLVLGLWGPCTVVAGGGG